MTATRKRRTRTGNGSDERVVAVASALERLATALPPEQTLILALCDAHGRPNDVLVRDREGRMAVLEGVPEHLRPELSGIIGVTKRQLERKPDTSIGAEVAGVADSGSLMRTIIEHAPMPLMLADRGGIVRYASAPMDDFGYRAGEVVGDRLFDYVHPDDRDRLAHVHERLAGGERPSAVMDVRWRRRDGSYSSVEARMRAAGDAHGPLAGVVVVGLRRLPGPWAGHADIAAAAHRNRVLADASDCGVAIVSGAEDTLGTILDANASLGRIVGETTGRLVGTSLTSLVADHDAGRLSTVLRSAWTRGQPHHLEVTIAGAQGSGRRAEIGITADATGPERSELIVRMRDVTGQLRQVADLSNAVERLERTNHELAEFARITAHDLRAPLLALSRLVDLTAGGQDDPDSPASMDAIRTAVNRMRGMVDGVMGYADSLEAAPRRGPVNLDEVLQRVLESLSEEIARREVALTSAELPIVYGNEHQLERVFLNLIANALKYSGERPPRVHLEAHPEPEAWRISVSDEGVGVREADRTRIFELFTRAEPRVGGRGIGLATSRRIVELHGGRIWVEPNEGPGSTFHFTIPNEPHF
jgi:PAS domain S-box-containing protein